MDTMKAIAKRKSTRAFAPGKPVDKATLETILAAGCAAPVGNADYASLHMTVISDPAALKSIDAATKAVTGADDSLLYGAPAFVVLSAAAEQKAPNIQYANVGCILENMMLAAADAGVDSVYLWGAPTIMAGSADLCKQLGIPDGFTPISGVALGYAAAPNPAERDLRVTLAVNYV